MHAPLLAPSLLAGDHSRLAESAALAAAAGCRWLHLDIMDGHFVPNLSFGPATVAALRPSCPLFFDTHLMLSQPADYIEAFVKAGADGITIHVEPDHDTAAVLQRIRAHGKRTGIALNPATPAEAAEPYLEGVDLVLAMTVQPGFGGQSFRHEVLPKIRALDAQRRSRRLSFRIEVDGGVDLETAALCLEAGADTLVAGTSFFRAADRTAFRLRVETTGTQS